MGRKELSKDWAAVGNGGQLKKKRSVGEVVDGAWSRGVLNQGRGKGW